MLVSPYKSNQTTLHIYLHIGILFKHRISENYCNLVCPEGMTIKIRSTSLCTRLNQYKTIVEKLFY